MLEKTEQPIQIEVLFSPNFSNFVVNKVITNKKRMKKSAIMNELSIKLNFSLENEVWKLSKTAQLNAKLARKKRCFPYTFSTKLANRF